MAERCGFGPGQVSGRTSPNRNCDRTPCSALRRSLQLDDGQVLPALHELDDDIKPLHAHSLLIHWPSRTWLDSPGMIVRLVSVIPIRRRRPSEPLMWAMLIVPRRVEPDLPTHRIEPERHENTPRVLGLEGEHEPLDHRDRPRRQLHLINDIRSEPSG